MGRAIVPLALVVTFALGIAVGAVARRGGPPAPDGDRQETVARLEQKVSTLTARLRAREDLATARPPSAAATMGKASSDGWPGPGSGFVAAGATDDRGSVPGGARAVAPRPGAGGAERTGAASGARAATPATVQAALERFYRYLEVMNGTPGRERWQQARELLGELRGMGDAAGQALMQVLASGGDSDERRTAARLLGAMQVPQALPLLRDVIDHDQDVLLRRAAASALRQLQTPDAIPVMERLLGNPVEDRIVRLSAASGLAESGRPLGVLGLTQIFEETTADGRGRDLAFRALVSLNDERPLPFLRQLVASQVEPAYRLRAIRYVTMQGDRQALAALQLVMHAPNEQPSIRDAAAQAYVAINGSR